MTDFYKTIHHNCYPDNTEKLYYYWIARTSRIKEINEVVFFGLQAYIKKFLIKEFRDNFFEKPKEEVVKYYENFISETLGKQYADVSHINTLHDLGYLPIRINALPEGKSVPIGCPMIEVTNTHPDFFWLPGHLETLMSCNLWMPTTTATTTKTFYDYLCKHYCSNWRNLPYAATDFSQRGMTSLESAEMNGAAHLLFFHKTANIPAISFLIKYYNAKLYELNNAGTPSTEHSVMSAYADNELEAYRTLLNRYPTGTLSIVSDTYDLWNVVNNYLPILKETIMSRDGTIVIRPDSGNPPDIICGNPFAKTTSERKGVVELLWDIFGGEQRSFTSDKILDPHIRVIYGDAITLSRCKEICERLKYKNFSPTNVIFGIGSYTYQYVTRDTFGFALKATHAVIDGKEVQLYKDPVTDENRIKKSIKGRCLVYKEYKDERIKYKDGLYNDAVDENSGQLLRTVFEDGRLHVDDTYLEIQERVKHGTNVF
jgi:nicotinamide phosphoribosyltransferase